MICVDFVASFLEKAILASQNFSFPKSESVGEPSMLRICQMHPLRGELVSPPPIIHRAMTLRVLRITQYLAPLLGSLRHLVPKS